LTLRRTLLLAFVLLGLLPSVALSWLSFSRTREAMTGQIRQGLEVQARSLQTAIDAMLFERFENALVWSRSELMQDLRLADVDKRVTNYLVDLRSGYGDVYEDIDCRAPDGLVVASATAGRIGRRPDPAAEGPLRPAMDARLDGGTARLSVPDTATLDDRAPLVIETGIPLGYAAAGTSPQRLRLAFNARQISRLLDAAAGARRVIVVVDAQGRWIAGSSALRGHAMPDVAARAAAVALARSAAPTVAGGGPWSAGPALVGRGVSAATSTFAGSGWTTLVFEPVDAALAPIARIAWIFAGLLVAVLGATTLAGGWIADAISRPIVALTARTRRYREGRADDGDRAVDAPAAPDSPDAPPAGPRIAELDVLARAFDEMVQSIDRSRRELVRTSKMAMLGELAAVLAHEVRTPLGILRASAQVLARDAGLGPDGRELVTFIESETERLNGLVSTLLDTARPRTPSVAPCDVHALLRRCAQMHDLRRGADGVAHPVILRLDAHDPLASVDEEQLTGAVFNLLNNATQAAGAAGRVEIATFDDGERLGLRVADDGPGIPATLMDRLFDPFVTGREGGIGLGLAVVRQVVAAHAGEITVGRGAWGGAAFTLRLPRRPPPPLQEDTP
jgi:signal transduction histidine kinase